jgi:pyruvate-formate lyase-activating enzyme
MGRSASVEQMMAEVAGDQANYRHFLLSGSARVVLRCSLVPGVNDSAGHLAGIAAVAARFPSLQGVEIVAHHDSGSHKALRIRQLHRLPYHFPVRRRCR